MSQIRIGWGKKLRLSLPVIRPRSSSVRPSRLFAQFNSHSVFIAAYRSQCGGIICCQVLRRADRKTQRTEGHCKVRKTAAGGREQKVRDRWCRLPLCRCLRSFWHYWGSWVPRLPHCYPTGRWVQMWAPISWLPSRRCRDCGWTAPGTAPESSAARLSTRCWHCRLIFRPHAPLWCFPAWWRQWDSAWPP